MKLSELMMMMGVKMVQRRKRRKGVMLEMMLMLMMGVTTVLMMVLRMAVWLEMMLMIRKVVETLIMVLWRGSWMQQLSELESHDKQNGYE